MKEIIQSGVYPTMITPYGEDGEIDYGAVKALVEFYAEAGCKGIFAVCQSSEMAFLSLQEKEKLAKAVVDASAGRLDVVASGHTSASFAQQKEEFLRVSGTGVKAFVCVTNRFDTDKFGEEKWIEEATRFLDETASENIPLGLYECPLPYKRLLTDKMVEWLGQTGRFAFIKDTCCDPSALIRRGEILSGTGVKLFNANAQTTLLSLKNGGAGYSGIMANFHPKLYVWLCENPEDERAEYVQQVLSMTAFTEQLAYPVTAKYHLSTHEGIPMSLFARSRNRNELKRYDRHCIDDMFRLTRKVEEELGI